MFTLFHNNAFFFLQTLHTPSFNLSHEMQFKGHARMTENTFMYDDMPMCPLCSDGEISWTNDNGNVELLMCHSCDFVCSHSRGVMLLIHTLQNEVASLRRQLNSVRRSIQLSNNMQREAPNQLSEEEV